MSQIIEDDDGIDVNDEEYHNLLKRFIKNTNNAKQDIIDAAKRLED